MPLVDVARASAASCTAGSTTPLSVATPSFTDTRKPSAPRVRESAVSRARSLASATTSDALPSTSFGIAAVTKPAQLMISSRLCHAHMAMPTRLTGTAVLISRRITPLVYNAAHLGGQAILVTPASRTLARRMPDAPQNASVNPSAVDRHPHLDDAPPDGWVRVDFHSHTMWSGDCTTTPEELEEAVVDTGIDVLCITDHSTTNGAKALASRLPCRVVVGEELRTGAGEVIGLFLTERLPFGIGHVEAAERIRAQGGLVYIPHPYDPTRHCLREDALVELLDRGLVDGLEVFNAKKSLQSLNAKATETARARDLPGGAGSDAHVPEALGAAYLVMPDFDGPASMLAAMREGRVVGHHWDGHRPWRPRIVPSTKAH